MSRITKEEIEKTKCGRFLLSDENIYLSIYSLNSYVFEYNLLNTEDRILYHRLQDKFDARLINVMLMNFFAHCEKILRINLNPENWKDMKWDEIIDNQINEENKITCHLRNKIRSC